MLFVSHNLGAIERLCHKTLLLKEGKPELFGKTSDAISTYLDRDSGSKTMWEPKGAYPDHPHFRRAWLCNADGSHCPTPTASSCLGVTVEFCMSAEEPGLILGLAVRNEMEQPVFATSPLDCDHRMPRRAGVYRTTVVFPKGVLLPKLYSIQIVLYTLGRIFDSHMNALSFSVEDGDSLANRIPRVGELQLACEWSPFVECHSPLGANEAYALI